MVPGTAGPWQALGIPQALSSLQEQGFWKLLWGGVPRAPSAMGGAERVFPRVFPGGCFQCHFGGEGPLAPRVAMGRRVPWPPALISGKEGEYHQGCSQRGVLGLSPSVGGGDPWFPTLASGKGKPWTGSGLRMGVTIGLRWGWARAVPQGC